MYNTLHKIAKIILSCIIYLGEIKNEVIHCDTRSSTYKRAR